MSVTDYTAIAAFVITLVGFIFGAMKFYVRAIMRELTPNAGQSLKDQVGRIEARLNELILELAIRK